MFRRNFVYGSLFLLIISILSCGLLQSKYRYEHDENIKPLLKVRPVYPATRFFVLSDIHYYDSSLGISGSEFQKYLNNDRKLLKESSEILASAVEDITDKEADFVIISGDLTKDGEMINHQKVAFHLKKLLESEKKVFVVPGNHDVANGKSVRYQDDRTVAVPNVSKKEFESIYNDYGYGSALKRDPSSLSYLSEPVPGLWLLALDSCRWQENESNHKAITSGKFSDYASRILRPKGKTDLEALMLVSVVGPIGLPLEEATYPAVSTADGKPMNAKHDYVVRMTKDQLPPAQAF